MARIAVLRQGDEAAVEGFLSTRPDTTMFLRSNLRAAGLVDEGRAFQGTWAAAWEDDRIVAAAALFWNGKLIVEAPVELAAVVRAAAAAAPRAVTGLLGPYDQAEAARRALGLVDVAAQLDSKDRLYVLDLAELVVPGSLGSGAWRCRRPVATDVPLLARWRAAYHVEILGATASPALDEEAAADIRDGVARGIWWVLEEDAVIVSMTAFNAQLPDTVQVGGVYTPPRSRGRGLARAVVAGSLLDARAAGARRAILFTGEDNLAAQRAYGALGFHLAGDYRLILYS